ncbi:hypothetical protein GQ53DRAFT_846980 [Thozetella sp. PMI_491]|nr:hypothetical protein GQ53DRAFT_846980 [Thozetella sp. PMI_491]
MAPSCASPSRAVLHLARPQSSDLISGFLGDANPAEVSSQLADWITLIEQQDEYIGLAKTSALVNSTAVVNLPLQFAKDDPSSVDAYLPPTALNILVGVTPSELTSWNVAERHLLNHFLQSVSRALVVAPDAQNPFLWVFVPLALENQTVKHSLLTLSACHFSRIYPDWSQNVLTHQSRALLSLKAELKGSGDTKWALAATLLLCLTEVLCEGTSRKWLLHLNGARALLPSHSETNDPGTHMAAMIQVYNYLCCVTSLSSEDVPSALKTAESVADESPSVHPFFGMTESLHRSLVRINRLSARVRNHSDHDKNFKEEIAKEARDIGLSLRSWSPLEETGYSRQTSEARAVMSATEWAIMMRLHQVTGPAENNDDLIKKATGNILSALSLIRPGSEMESHLLFPLFMAGTGSTTKSNRLTVEYRITTMETTIGFGHIYVAHRLLDELWWRANHGEAVYWETLMRTKYPGLVLF